MSRYLVVSSDCHGGLPPGKYLDYLDPQYRDSSMITFAISTFIFAKLERSVGLMNGPIEWETVALSRPSGLARRARVILTRLTMICLVTRVPG